MAEQEKMVALDGSLVPKYPVAEEPVAQPAALPPAAPPRAAPSRAAPSPAPPSSAAPGPSHQPSTSSAIPPELIESSNSNNSYMTAGEQWDVAEAIRVTGEAADANTTITGRPERKTGPADGQVRYREMGLGQPIQRGPHVFNRQRRNDFDAEEIPPEAWKDLEGQLAELVDFLKEEDEKKKVETDPVKLYLYEVDDENTYKIYNTKDDGFRILQTTRSEKEQLQIERSNYEILKFVYSRTNEVVHAGHAMNWNQMEMSILQKIDRFIREHHMTSFRSGAFSVAIGFDDFLPALTFREQQDKIILLRPVLIDGVAVLRATQAYDESYKPFAGHDWEMPIYHEVLNLPVKAIFELIMNFLIRGHKTVVFLPVYYQDYITPGGIAKVDDIFAFQRLIDLEYIQFHRVPQRKRWFNELCAKVDEIGAVFVSSIEYRKRDAKITYESPSERIITPCFLNTEDRLMIVQPTIRYRPQGSKKFKMITEKQVLQFTDPADQRIPLGEQLYLDQQVEAICNLCQLYPMKFLHEISIKQLLGLVVHADSGFTMPSMDLDAFWNLHEKFG